MPSLLWQWTANRRYVFCSKAIIIALAQLRMSLMRCSPCSSYMSQRIEVGYIFCVCMWLFVHLVGIAVYLAITYTLHTSIASVIQIVAIIGKRSYIWWSWGCCCIVFLRNETCKSLESNHGRRTPTSTCGQDQRGKGTMLHFTRCSYALLFSRSCLLYCALQVGCQLHIVR